MSDQSTDDAVKMRRMFNPDTLKDEYHEALARGLDKLMLRDDVKRKVLKARKTDTEAYIALAALAHEHGAPALLLGVRLWLPSEK